MKSLVYFIIKGFVSQARPGVLLALQCLDELLRSGGRGWSPILPPRVAREGEAQRGGTCHSVSLWIQLWPPCGPGAQDTTFGWGMYQDDSLMSTYIQPTLLLVPGYPGPQLLHGDSSHWPPCHFSKGKHRGSRLPELASQYHGLSHLISCKMLGTGR